MCFASGQKAPNERAMVATILGWFSDQQKGAVGRYLIGVRSMLNEPIHLSELHLIDGAQVIWDS